MKTLLLDIETAPHLSFSWGLWDQNIAISQIVTPGYTLCWSAKWLDSKKVEFAKIGEENFLQRLYDMMSEADVIVGYNSDKFDVPTLHKEFLMLGLTPPSPSKRIDLFKTVKRQFRFASNKLDFVCQQLGIGAKVHHKGMELWRDCMDGKASAWKIMKAYNKMDVILLEKLYYKIRPWILNHPNVALYTLSEDPICPKCGSEDIERRGYSHSGVGVFAKVVCRECGNWSRFRTNELPKEERDNLLVDLR